ncbi:MAG: hypothetical protein QME64_07715 [bacterium]|nr:hypothetical protein [bacterium]
MNEIPTNIPEPTKPKKLITAERALFDTIREYLGHFWQYLLVAVIVLVPVSGFTAWFNPEIRDWYLSIPFAIITTLITFYPHIALLYLAKDNITNNPTKISDAYLTSATIFLPFAWTMIIVSLATLLGFIFCIIPGIIAMVLFCVSDGVVVWERQQGLPAIQRSVKLIKIHFWKVFWILLFYELVLGGVSIILELIPTFFNPALPHWIKNILNFNISATPVYQPWGYIFYKQLIWVFFYPTNAIMTFILYRSLKEVSEQKAEQQKLELPLNL